MPRFTFRFQTLLKMRVAERDRRREELADAFRVDEALKQQLQEIEQTLTENHRISCAASQPGEIDIDDLLRNHRHALVLRSQRQTVTNQREQVHAEIERRRLALVEADRAIKILEKLRETQLMRYQTNEQKSDMRQMDEITMRRNIVRRKENHQ